MIKTVQCIGLIFREKLSIQGFHLRQCVKIRSWRPNVQKWKSRQTSKKEFLRNSDLVVDHISQNNQFAPNADCPADSDRSYTPLA